MSGSLNSDPAPNSPKISVKTLFTFLWEEGREFGETGAGLKVIVTCWEHTPPGTCVLILCFYEPPSAIDL